MKKTIILLCWMAVCMFFSSCGQDPFFEFKDDGKIYFKYPLKVNDLGIETNTLVDSIVYSSHGKILPDGKDTIWLKVQIMGARLDVDREYRVAVVADSSSATEGVDFEQLADSYILHRNVGVDSFPLILNKKAYENVFSRNVLLKLEETKDLKIAFVEFSTIKVNFSAYLLEPAWWFAFETLLGKYHPLKYDKVVEIYGSTDIDPYGSNPYCTYVANMVKDWFEDNIVIDPFTGERLELL